jgi:hypothetical protein
MGSSFLYYLRLHSGLVILGLAKNLATRFFFELFIAFSGYQVICRTDREQGGIPLEYNVA